MAYIVVVYACQLLNDKPDSNGMEVSMKAAPLYLICVKSIILMLWLKGGVPYWFNVYKIF